MGSREVGYLEQEMQRLERDLVIRAVEMFRGNFSKAADYLGINRNRIHRVLKRNEIDPAALKRKYEPWRKLCNINLETK